MGAPEAPEFRFFSKGSSSSVLRWALLEPKVIARHRAEMFLMGPAMKADVLLHSLRQKLDQRQPPLAGRVADPEMLPAPVQSGKLQWHPVSARTSV